MMPAETTPLSGKPSALVSSVCLFAKNRIAQAKDRSPHLPVRILNVYIEASMGFSFIYCSVGLNRTLLFQGYVLEMAPTVRTVGGTYIPRIEEGVRGL